ncbi:alpha/beta hydrolase family protein [Nonomuraea sp. NPDC050536]|uniref:alpha/beta hydrolase family protein n=1 Tax=Nonomuraea sp. NPDC050536 TaxID=3364366 RepID=UPI0037C66F70
MTLTRALRWCMASAGAFTTLILLTTQSRAVRVFSPWQDDPYDVVISATELLVPALALAIAIRARVRPASGDLLRGARVVLVAVVATAVTCWASVAAGAHADVRGWQQQLLIAGLAVVTLSAVPLAVALRRAGPATRDDTDWVEDFLTAVARLRIPVGWARRLAQVLRAHRILAAVLLATAVSGWLALAEAIGDGLGPRPLQAAAFRVVVGATLLVALLVPVNAYLGLLHSSRPSRRTPVLMAALYGAAVSVPVTVAFREGIGHLLDYPLDTLGDISRLVAWLAAVVALVTLLVQAFRTRGRRVSRILVGLPLVLVVLVVGYLGVVTVQRVLPQDLPAPTGAYGVGRTFREWTDTSRTDPLAPHPGLPRELSVWIWYPTQQGTSGPRAPYAPGQWGKQHIPTPLPGLGEGSFAAVRTRAVDEANVAPGRFPLVVLMPGMGLDAPVFSTLAQDLASHGYLVASLTPTYSANVTVLHGRPVTSTPSGKPDDFDERNAERLIGVWTADARFVATRAADLDRDTRLAGHVDTGHPLYVGHSFGGATAFQACHDDPSCAGAVDLDGTLYGDVVRTGLRAPALILGGDNSCVTGTCQAGDAESQGIRDQTRRLLAAAAGPVWRYEIAGTGHFNFTDYAVIYLAAPIRALFPLESIDGARGLRIQDAYVTQFADQAVRHHPSPLLSGDHPYPEVRALR